MELGSNGHEVNVINKDADKAFDTAVKGDSAPHSSQIPEGEGFSIAPLTTDLHAKNEAPSSVESLNTDPASACISKFPSLTTDLNSVPAELENSEPSPIDTQSNSQDEHLLVDQQRKTSDGSVILSLSVSGEGETATGGGLQVPSTALGVSTEIKDASNPEQLLVHKAANETTETFSNSSPSALVSKGETSIAVETEKGLVEENLVSRTVQETSHIQPSDEVVLKQGNNVERLVDPSGGVAMVVDETREAAQEKDSMKVEDSSQKEATELNIEAIKGQKVSKKFGKKSYSGEVIGYDPESKWFKVVYEDGDEEDLELWEVKAILSSSGSTSATAKKSSSAEDSAIAKVQKSSNKPKKSGNDSSATKANKSKMKNYKKSLKAGGPQTKKSSSIKKAKNAGSSQGKTKSSNASRSLKLVSPKNEKKGKSRGSEGSALKKDSKKSAPSKQQKTGVKRKAEEKDSKNEHEVKKMKTESTEPGKTQDTSSEGDAFVGKNVRKDFDGKLYDGVVVKFDKKTQYYKVKYEDGDQEELELHELQPILV